MKVKNKKQAAKKVAKKKFKTVCKPVTKKVKTKTKAKPKKKAVESRGRPKGSKNKPKLAIFLEQQIKDYLKKEGKTMSNEAMEQAINTLLTNATAGKITDIKLLMEKAAAAELVTDKLAKSEVAKQKIESELEASQRSLMRAMAPKPAATAGKVGVGTGQLTYKVVMTPAHKLFNEVHKAEKFLNFDIPFLEWHDSTGAKVSNIEVPEIDVNYDFQPDNLLKFLTGQNRNMNQWLFGHTGTGKSTFVEQVASRMGWPVTRINLDSSLERADLVGHVGLHEENGTTVSKFEEGILPQAMVKPGFLLMDEIDAGRPDILFVVQRALEHNGLTLTEDKGRVVDSHELFRFVATSNTRGQGDEYGMYAGTRNMNASMIDRFPCFIEFDYLPPDRELALLKKLEPGLPQAIAENIVQFAAEIRAAFRKGELYMTVSPRGLSMLAGCYVSFLSYGNKARALKLAMEMTILSKCTNDTRQKYLEIGARVFPEAIA